MVKTMTKKRAKKPKPPKFEVTAKRGTKLGKYQTALWKWLKVIFWHYDDLKNRVDELEKTVKLIRKEVEILKKRLNE
jgi:hypothetical protein